MKSTFLTNVQPDPPVPQHGRIGGLPVQNLTDAVQKNARAWLGTTG